MKKLVERFLACHFAFHPGDARFIGQAGHDHRLPPADAEVVARQAEDLRALLADVPDGDDMEHRLLRNVILHALRDLQDRPRYRDPSWYTGEVAFGLIALLLPTELPVEPAAVESRLAAIPGFLKAAAWHIAGTAFHGATARARTEVAAIRVLLCGGLRRHCLWRPGMDSLMETADAALQEFDALLSGLSDADPRCGAAHLDFVMREVHALPFGRAGAIALAEDAMALAEADLRAMAARRDRERNWRTQLDDINRLCPPPELIAATYRHWHERAMADAAGLVTPATDYHLDFRPFPAWAELVYPSLYFLAYRCPPADVAGAGSIYWTHPAGQSLAAIKSNHAVHHGSIGHHTQNARARAAGGLARILGQDMARGIMAQAAGTMCEGWSCYVQELMTEIEGFYDADDLLVARANELRHAAGLIADIRLHSGEWNLAQTETHLRDIALIPAARVSFEAVKSALYPGNRLMYWAGLEQIRRARHRWKGDPKIFHDRLLAHGHVPVAWAIEATTRG